MNVSDNRSQVDYRVRRGAISTFGRALRSSQLLWWTMCFFTTAGIAVLLFLLLTLPEAAPLTLKLWITLAILLIGIGFPIFWSLTHRHFIEPDLAFRKWLQQVCDGDFDARIDLPGSHQHFKELNFHTRNLALTLTQLSNEMESAVESQTRTLEQQKQVRNLLFHIAADIARETEKETVIKAVSHRLAIWWGRAHIYGYLINNHEFVCVSAISINKEQEERIGSPKIPPISELVEHVFVSNESSGRFSTEIRIPFDAGKTAVGMLLIECGPIDPLRVEETERVSNTVSEQLSLFMTKRVVADREQGAQIIHERTAMAAEIHDSLAQTLLASRYQLSLLKDSLDEKQINWKEELQRVENTIGMANNQVRELIHEYRTPLTALTSIDSLRRLIDRFRESTGMDVFFQCDNHLIQFSQEEEPVVQRIVSESLANAQKYSKADVIRVYIRGNRSGIRSVLVEDDGIGFDPSALNEFSSDCTQINGEEHFGMSIMQERALSIGAVLTVESEPGDGTRLSLKLPPRLDG